MIKTIVEKREVEVCDECGCDAKYIRVRSNGGKVLCEGCAWRLFHLDSEMYCAYCHKRLPEGKIILDEQHNLYCSTTCSVNEIERLQRKEQENENKE